MRTMLSSTRKAVDVCERTGAEEMAMTTAFLLVLYDGHGRVLVLVVGD